MADQRDLAKEVEEITRRANEHMHERHYRQYASDRDSLLAFIASQSRELEEQKQWSAEWHKALETAAVVIEAQSNGSPTEVVESIRARFDSLQSELAALRRPVVQSDEIQAIKARLAMVFNGDYVFEHDDAMSAMDKLLSALDQARRELSAVRAAANKQGDGDLAELERLRAEIARLSSPPEERGEIVERQACRKDCLANGDAFGAVIATRDIDVLLQDLRRYSNAHKILLAERDKCKEVSERACVSAQRSADAAAKLEFENARLTHERDEARGKCEQLERDLFQSNNRIDGHKKTEQDLYRKLECFRNERAVDAERIERLRVALHKFGRHRPRCAANLGGTDCDCGLYAALAAADGQQHSHPDATRIDWIESECADLRCHVRQYEDDADTYYQVVRFHMDAPKERVVGEGKDARAAIDAAMIASKAAP